MIDTAAPGAEEQFAAARARAGRRPGRDPRRAARRRRAGGARAAQVRDQEHDGLPALRVPRRRRRRSRSSAGWSSARRARSPSSPRPSSRPCRVPRTRRSRGFTSPTSTRAAEPVPQLVEAGASAVELMVAPALMVASHNIRRRARALARAAARVRGAAGRVRRRRRRASSPRPEAQRGEAARAASELLRDRPPSPATPSAIELAWRVREGMFGLVGRLRPPGRR